jgi:hypothetical protein
MKNFFLSLLILCALAPRPARAVFCVGAAQLEAQVELCDDNEKYAQAAEACRNEYLDAVKKEQASLAKILGKSVGAATGKQNVTEGVSSATYKTTIGRLDALIARGLATHAEQMGYVAHFLPPFHWPKDAGPMPAPDDPALWKAYDGEFCFGEHKETIDHMVKDVDQAVEDLRNARKEAVALKATSNANKAGLDGSLAAPPVTKGKAELGTGKKGGSPVQKSDITGTEQRKDK